MVSKGNYNNKNFSKNLNYLMQKNNIKSKELSLKLNLSKSAISNYLSGRAVPRHHTLAQIAELFDVQIDTMFQENAFPEKVSMYGKKVNTKNPSTTFMEGGKNDILFFQAPLFAKKLISLDVVYINDNFCDRILSSFPFYQDKECYAVKITDSLMENSGIMNGSIVIFAAATEVKNNELAAVLLKEEREVVIRRVKFSKNKLALISDNGENFVNHSSSDVVVLGKVVTATFCPE